MIPNIASLEAWTLTHMVGSWTMLTLDVVRKGLLLMQYYAMPANLNSLARRIQRKTVILYWGHHAQLMKQSRSEFSQAPKNAAMRSCRGIAIVCTIRRVKKTDEMNKVILIFIRYTNVYTHTHMCGTVSP